MKFPTGLYPDTGETKIDFCRRLEADGYEEMAIRKALHSHYPMTLEELGDFFEDFETARLRHIETLYQQVPTRSSYSLTVKVRRNLGISHERAEYWVNAFLAAKILTCDRK